MASLRALAIRPSVAGRFDERSVRLLASSPRSGSTWLGGALLAIPRSCVLFEPLQLVHVPAARKAGFSWRTYASPEERWPEGEAHLRRVFEGRVINRWTIREMSLREARRATTMIVKFVRANRLLPWICRVFHLRPPVLLMRHPCAVIASQLRGRHWKNARRPAAPPYIADYPAFERARTRTEGIEENLAAIWALDQLPALMQEPPRPWIIVSYEELVLRPESALAKIFQAWDVDVDLGAAVARLARPSSVVYRSGISGLGGWQQQLSEEQVSRILRTVEGFGLRFYDREAEPDYGALFGEALPAQIRKAGTS